jgi:hypothetical protein
MRVNVLPYPIADQTGAMGMCCAHQEQQLTMQGCIWPSPSLYSKPEEGHTPALDRLQHRPLVFPGDGLPPLILRGGSMPSSRLNHHSSRGSPWPSA